MTERTAPSYLARWEVAEVDGVVVVIDVIRAFTTAAYALAGGASAIWLVAGVREAIELGKSIPGSLVMGEDHGRRPEGFAESRQLPLEGLGPRILLGFEILLPFFGGLALLG